MKKIIAMFVAASLCLALLAGCGSNVGLPNRDAPAFNENAPPTTDTAAQETTILTTTKIASTTSATSTTHFKDVGPPLKLLEYKMDENGIFYIDRPTCMEHFDQDWYQVVYSTVQVKFQHGQKDWLVQMWKGRYGLVMLGCEICVATKPAAQRNEAYTLAAPGEALVFKLDLYQKDFSANQTKYLFTRGPEKAGWYNGFVPGKFFEDDKTAEIIMVGSITFPDVEMLRAFEASFTRAGFKKGTPGKDNPEKYAVNGTTLTFSWQDIDHDA